MSQRHSEVRMGEKTAKLEAKEGGLSQREGEEDQQRRPESIWSSTLHL